MALELEPLPPEPPQTPAPRPAVLRALRRRAVATVRSVRVGSARTLSRSVAFSLGVHACVFALLWVIFSLWPREPLERTVSIRISLSDYAEATDPEAEAGGASPKAEAPEDGPQDVASAAPGLLFDDEKEALTVGAGASPAGAAFLGRIGGHEALLQAGGGDAATEGALRLALAWLARHQNPDGTWDAVSFRSRCTGPACVGIGGAPYVDATTALALLPFLGAGHTHREGPWRDTVKLALRAIVARQRPDGSCGGDSRRGYATAISTLALAEAYGLTRSPSLREPAQRAVDGLARTQSGAGGWRYEPGDDEADSSVTGWATVALAAARRADLVVQERTLLGCRAWFRGVRDADGNIGYTARGGGSVALLGVGAIAQILLGDDPDSPLLAPTFDRLERRSPRPPADDGDGAGEFGATDPLHWYYGGLATFQLGGGTWKFWNERLRAALLPTQVHDESDAHGSWPPMGGSGRNGGRIITTALCALSLEVYYRYPRATMR